MTRWCTALLLALTGCDDEVVGFAGEGSSSGGMASASSSSSGTVTPSEASSSSSSGEAPATSPDFALYGLDAGLALSYDGGLSWEMVDVPELQGFPQEAMIAGPNGLILVGGSTMATSSDGVTWVLGMIGGPPGYVRHLASNGTRWVSVGLDHLAWSDDGVSWTDAMEGLDSFDMLEVTWGGGRFFALGFDTLLTSTDGTTWTKRGVDGSKLLSVAYANGRFVGLGEGGRIVVTENGTDLLFDQENLLPGLAGSVRSCRGGFVVASEGALFFSQDGESWDELAAPSSGLVACSEDSVVTVQDGVAHHGPDEFALTSVFSFDGSPHALDYVGNAPG
ncbi:MAG: hypothetical protein AAGA54_26580 [Myxococcota bacterium]